MTKKLMIHDTEISEVMTEISHDYYPGQRFPLEPSESVTISIVTHRVSATGHHAVYRKDTNFSGSMAEALALFEWVD